MAVSFQLFFLLLSSQQFRFGTVGGRNTKRRTFTPFSIKFNSKSLKLPNTFPHQKLFSKKKKVCKCMWYGIRWLGPEWQWDREEKKLGEKSIPFTVINLLLYSLWSLPVKFFVFPLYASTFVSKRFHLLGNIYVICFTTAIWFYAIWNIAL